jgi:hypothetical protein
LDDDVTTHERPTNERTEWNDDPTQDYAVGPDDAGNGVMFGIGLITRAYRWIANKITNRP